MALNDLKKKKKKKMNQKCAKNFKLGINIQTAAKGHTDLWLWPVIQQVSTFHSKFKFSFRLPCSPPGQQGPEGALSLPTLHRLAITPEKRSFPREL